MILIDPALAAVILRRTPRTIRRLVTSGQLTNHGTPRRILIDLEQAADLATHRHAVGDSPRR